MAHPVHHLILGTLIPAYRLTARVTQSGRSHLPEGGCVLAFNHPRNRDPVDVQAAYGGPLYFLGKKEAFDWPVVGWVLRNVGNQIPLDRQKGGNLAAIEEAVEHLRAGHKIALAPEGTKSRNGPLGRGRSGAVRMAWAADVPVIPVAVKHGLFGTHVVFGDPVDLDDLSKDAMDMADVRTATDRMMAQLAEMLGEPYHAGTAPDYAAQKGLRHDP